MHRNGTFRSIIWCSKIWIFHSISSVRSANTHGWQVCSEKEFDIFFFFCRERLKTIKRSSDLCVLSLLLSASLFLFLLMMMTLLGNLVIQWKLLVQKLFLILPGVSVVVVVLRRRSFVVFSMGFGVFHLSTGTRSTSFFFLSPVLTHSDHLPSWTTFLSVFLFFFLGGQLHPLFLS